MILKKKTGIYTKIRELLKDKPRCPGGLFLSLWVCSSGEYTTSQNFGIRSFQFLNNFLPMKAIVPKFNRIHSVRS